MIKNIIIVITSALFLAFGQSCTTQATSAEIAHTGVGQEESITKNIGPNDFKEGIAKQKNAILLDVRTPQELEQGYLEGAININFSSPDFTNQLDRLDKAKPVYVYCRSGRRSASAMSTLEGLGFSEVYNLQGGF
jgi:rhodanese-related sulfurtransferase